MPGHADDLLDRIRARAALVGVIGLGYAGLPLGRAFAAAGFRVLGFDTDPEKVARLNGGESPVGTVPDADVRRMREGGFRATADLSRLGEPDALLVCVPTPLGPGGAPDLSCVRAAVSAAVAVLRPGQLVVLESTTYPGTTRGVVAPLLAARGLVLGENIFLAYSPEREDPGSPGRTVSRLPKVVAGLDPDSHRLACALYEGVAGSVVTVPSPEVAEAAKLLENTYRAVNIALVNELKVAFEAMGVDVWEVIDAAATKPFGFERFDPGPGPGGHCIPVNPAYLAWAARAHGSPARLVETACAVNAAMPDSVAGRVDEALRAEGKAVRGGRVLALGVSYKRDVGDARGAPGPAILGLLAARGAAVAYHDPFVPQLPAEETRPALVSEPLTEELLRGQDCVVVVTDHSAFDWGWVLAHARLVVDTRNVTRGVTGRARVVRA